MALEPITRAEQIMSGESLEPITREEMFLAKAAGMDVDTPEPITRREMFLSKISGGGGGGSGGGGWVVCEETEVTQATTLDKLQGLNLSLPNAESVGDWSFRISPGLTSVDLPAATSIGERAFNLCTALISVYLPVATSIGKGAFSQCTALTSVDLPAATSIGDIAFYGCTNLSTIILRTTETVCVAELSAFSETPLTAGQGRIYVPAVMYEHYRAGYEEPLNAAMGAGAFDFLFRKIEDYPEICG